MPKEDGYKNLIPLNKKSKEEQRRIQSKGGSTPTPKKAEAAKMRFIKERLMKNNLTAADVAWVMEKVENRKSMGYELAAWAEKQKKEMPPEQAFKVGELMTQVAKFIHGDKSSVDVRSVNINVDTMFEDVEEHLKKIFGDKK